jgi:hypothetical protein
MARRAGTLAPVREACVEFRLRHLTRDAVFQSPHDMEDVEAAVLTNSRRESERYTEVQLPSDSDPIPVCD